MLNAGACTLERYKCVDFFVVDICNVSITCTGIDVDGSHGGRSGCSGGGSGLCRDQGRAVLLSHSVVLVRTHCTWTHNRHCEGRV